MAMREGMDYPHDRLRYNWKLLMKNHPHDSICGCSIDAVHREMETRFEKSLEVSEQIVEDAKEFMASEIDTSFFGKYGKSAIPFVVWNTVGWNRTETTEVTLDLYKDDKDDLTQAYRELENFPLDEWRLINHKGKEIPCEIKDQGVQFGYILPEDAFRKRYMSRQVTVSFQTEIEAMGYRTFALVPGKKIAFEKESLITGQNRIQ